MGGQLRNHRERSCCSGWAWTDLPDHAESRRGIRGSSWKCRCVHDYTTPTSSIQIESVQSPISDSKSRTRILGTGHEVLPCNERDEHLERTDESFVQLADLGWEDDMGRSVVLEIPRTNDC